MHISSLSIRNFRNFKTAKLTFEKGINTIIGENGAGKTNLFHALRILLDDSLPRYTKFTQTDFSRKLENWSGHWIIISLEFDELDASEESQSLAIHSSGNMAAGKKGSYSVYFRPKHHIRKQLYEYSLEEDKDLPGLQLILDTITIEDYETAYLGRGSSDFSDDEMYEKYIGDFDEIIFPDPDDTEDDIFGTWLPKEINIHNEVSCTFIKALRDVESDLRSYSHNPLINLLRGKEKTVAIEKQHEIIESVDKLNTQISSLEEVKEIKQGIRKSIREAVGNTYAPTVDLKSELPNEMEKLFQSLKLWIGDPEDEGYQGKISELSLGGANLIYLSLKLLEYEKVKADRVANILLIEEPEAHIHTHIQKTLFSNLQENTTQVIISTHSTHISSVSKVRSVNILSRGDREAHVFQPSKNLIADDVIRIERYLDAVRSNLLFAKGVILVEGDTEQILIPEMYKKAFGLTLDEIGISLINIGSTGFENVAKMFHSDRIRKNCAILTDLDESIVELPDDDKKDTEYQRHCRNSKKSGEDRKNNLTTFCKTNKFLKPFYAKHTFEVDFLMNGNALEIEECIGKIYKTRDFIDSSKGKINNKSVAVAGVEILKLAKKCGKGWFALLVTEQLFYNTFIPTYILEAIAFASSHITEPTVWKMIQYRLKQIVNNDNDTYQEQAKKFSTKGKSMSEAIEAFKSDFTDDQLAVLIEYLHA